MTLWQLDFKPWKMDQQAIDDALEAARLAVEYDTREEYKQAIYYYAAAVKHLQTIQNPSLSEKAAEYQERIDNLQQIGKLFIVNNYSHLFY